MPTTPPQLRLPTIGPSPARRNWYANWSPSEAVSSSITQTRWPWKTPPGEVSTESRLRSKSSISVSRRSRSMIIGDTLPPPFERTSTTMASLRTWP